MVMHARKTQRIGDGYFDKHQAHPYQNSKYSSSKGSYDGGRGSMRDSPNGNSYRSESPDCDSPRIPSSYHSSKSSSYISSKSSRDSYKSRDKYSDCVRSPKDKRSRIDSDHRTNHDRNSSEKMLLNSVKVPQNSSRDSQRKNSSSSCQDKRDDRERVTRVGDWSEHVSSSGKKYYYNCKTEVSQWERPREWTERRPANHYPVAAARGPPTKYYASKPAPVAQPAQSTISGSGIDKHSNLRLSTSSSGSNSSKSGSSGTPLSRGVPTPVAPPTGMYWPIVPEAGASPAAATADATDMEICSGDSTPTSEPGTECAAVAANAPGPPDPGSPPVSEPPQLAPQLPTPVGVSTAPLAAAEPPPMATHPTPLAAAKVGLSSLAGLRPQPPHLTPSLANHYRDDLVNHVRGWPAEIIEKQAAKLSEEAYQYGTMCARVSAELKTPRSVVRQTEIKATRQEQRVLFLQQQIKTLEELKSQNSFMADET